MRIPAICRNAVVLRDLAQLVSELRNNEHNGTDGDIDIRMKCDAL